MGDVCDTNESVTTSVDLVHDALIRYLDDQETEFFQNILISGNLIVIAIC